MPQSYIRVGKLGNTGPCDSIQRLASGFRNEMKGYGILLHVWSHKAMAAPGEEAAMLLLFQALTALRAARAACALASRATGTRNGEQET